MIRRRALLVLAIVLGFASAAFAETGINTVVSLVENRYSVHHHGVPGLWLAKPFMLGSGVGGLKIAEFENFRVPSGDVYTLQEEVRRALGPEWSPFVETWSKSEREWSVIYARQRNNRLELLILDSDKEDGLTVLQMKVSGDAREEWISQPVGSARKDAHIQKTGN